VIDFHIADKMNNGFFTYLIGKDVSFEFRKGTYFLG